MPQTVDFNFGEKRGRTRSYSVLEHLRSSLDSGKAVRFSAREIQEEYGVKANSVGGAARKDAEQLSKELDKTIKVRVSLPDPEEKGYQWSDGTPAQDLVIQAYEAPAPKTNSGDGSGKGRR